MVRERSPPQETICQSQRQLLHQIKLNKLTSAALRSHSSQLWFHCLLLSIHTLVTCHTFDVSGAFDTVYKKRKEVVGRGFIILAEKVSLQGRSTSAVNESPKRQSASTLTELLRRGVRRDRGVKIDLRK